MKKYAVLLALVVAAVVAAAAGYWVGFRHAWEMGLMADAPIRGVLATHYLRALEKGRSDDLRTSFEGDIDVGLMMWALLEESPQFGAINALSGQDVVPGSEKYVRRLATYRKSHQSPLRDPELVERMLGSVRETDSTFAEDLEASGHEGDAAIDRMIEKYAE